MAVYNNRKTVAAALESALSQTYGNLELIVVDGGSKDGTLEVLENYADRLGILVSEPDEGLYEALNKGIGLAHGDVVGFLHSDDLFADERVTERIAKAFVDPTVDGVYGDLVYVREDEPERIVRYWKAGAFDAAQLRWGWMPPHPTLYMRRGVYERLGAFDTRYRIAADYDCMLRFLGKGGLSVAYIPEVLVKMRLGGASNRSIRNLVRKSAEDYRAMRNNGIGGILSLASKNLRKLPQFILRG